MRFFFAMYFVMWNGVLVIIYLTFADNFLSDRLLNVVMLFVGRWMWTLDCVVAKSTV